MGGRSRHSSGMGGHSRRMNGDSSYTLAEAQHDGERLNKDALRNTKAWHAYNVVAPGRSSRDGQPVPNMKEASGSEHSEESSCRTCWWTVSERDVLVCPVQSRWAWRMHRVALKSKALGPYIVLGRRSVRVHATSGAMLWLPKTAAHILLLTSRCKTQRWDHGKLTHAVVVQDLATQWIQSHPCKTKTSQETEKSLRKFLEPWRKPKVIYTDNSLEFGKSCEDLIMESSNFNTSSIRNKWHCWKSRTKSERRNFSSSATIRIGWKKVGWFFGMLLPSAERPRPLGGRENSLWKTIWGIIQRPIIPFGAMVEYYPIWTRDFSIGMKVLPGIFLGSELIAREILERRQKQEGCYSRSTKRKKGPLCQTDGHLSPQERGVKTQRTKIQRQSRAPGRRCKRRLWNLCSFYWTELDLRPRWLPQK